MKLTKLLRSVAFSPYQYKSLINGKLVNSIAGSVFTTENPATQTPIAEIAESRAADVDAAVSAAREAFDNGPWPRFSGRDRGKALYRLADALESHADELAYLETIDNGKPIRQSLSEMSIVVEHFRYFAGYADKMHGQTIQMGSDHHAITLHEPVGVVAQFTPWNYPLLMMAWKIAPALAMGNAVVLKISDLAPLAVLRVAELSLSAGFPNGALNIITGYGHIAGEALTRHMDVDMVSFTGSTSSGHKVMTACGMSNLKKLQLELGGKSVAIVCEDADLDTAVRDIHISNFANQGQTCCSTTRVYVHESVYDEFLNKSVQLAQARTVGDPLMGYDHGPQISSAALGRILKYVEIGKAEGAKLLTGGEKIERPGHFMSPAIFSNVQDAMTIAKEEIFGPVMSVLKWSSVSEVITRANSNVYGLSAGVWTKSLDTATIFSRNLQVGVVSINW